MHRLIELVILIFQFVQVECQCSYSALGHADYIGCFVDSDPIRKFPYVYGGIHFVSLTIDFCILGCADDGFKYAGMQGKSLVLQLFNSTVLHSMEKTFQVSQPNPKLFTQLA
ncbi:uncharacterized protein LOC143043458 isoform X2 [Mytilus galloprovincialis]|uniref:uncharacterized protein LOC143043458 isoform X2 n=1 Tax=Mytilus galloprovincialis TaxID=29158 RepID=UPI003F7B5F30